SLARGCGADGDLRVARDLVPRARREVDGVVQPRPWVRAPAEVAPVVDAARAGDDDDAVLVGAGVAGERRGGDLEADVGPARRRRRDGLAGDEVHGASTYWRWACRARSYSARAATTD